jgi:DNA helicase HerA-like ATPase
MDNLRIGMGETPIEFLPKFGNRHGLIAGATGTGKSVSLMVLAEAYSRIGTPVFLADVKGDLAGLSQAGAMNEKIAARVQTIGLTDYRSEGSPVIFWDLFGELGHPVRTTVSQMGPTLLARILELNDTQSGALAVAFEVADREGLLLLDLKDLRALLNHVAENRKAISSAIGLVNTASIGAIQRSLLRLEQEGGEAFFGEPALELIDLMRQDMSGRGIVNVLCAERLLLKPRLYSTFLLWLLSELFETLPEVGDLDKPKMIFCFDEAHLLFDDAPAALVQRVEQVVRLVRSKGVGVYFCTQLPDDVPDVILGQLGNRIQHGLRAFTPRDQKAIRSAAETFVSNPNLDVAKALIELGVGEALVSTLNEKGVPTPVQKALIAPPRCRMGAITPEERQAIKLRSPVGAKYDTAIDRESAYEKLKAQAEAATANEPTNPTAPPPTGEAPEGGFMGRIKEWMFGTKRRQGALEGMTKSAMRTVGNQVGRQILRGVLGGISGGRKR